jgi:protein SCO1
MKKYFFILFVSIVALSVKVHAQPSAQDTSGVGIVEHLGSHIPYDLKFMNDKGDTLTLKDIVNKPTVFSFVYFDCPGLCSPLLQGLSDVISKTDMMLGKDYQVVTISFNFRDTPEKAAKKKAIFTKRYSKDQSNNWIFLTTDSLTIFKVTDAFGYKVKAVGLDFVHPSAIVMVSPEGMITRYLYGISFLPFDLKMAIIEAGKEQARPTIQRVLLYCFGYDAEGKRYALEVTKLAATVIIFFAVVLFVSLIIRSRKKRKKQLKNTQE